MHQWQTNVAQLIESYSVSKMSVDQGQQNACAGFQSTQIEWALNMRYSCYFLGLYDAASFMIKTEGEKQSLSGRLVWEAPDRS